MTSVPEGLRYTKEHEWVLVEGDGGRQRRCGVHASVVDGEHEAERAGDRGHGTHAD